MNAALSAGDFSAAVLMLGAPIAAVGGNSRLLAALAALAMRNNVSDARSVLQAAAGEGNEVAVSALQVSTAAEVAALLAANVSGGSILLEVALTCLAASAATELGPVTAPTVPEVELADCGLTIGFS